jgi:hypothetical protein
MKVVVAATETRWNKVLFYRNFLNFLYNAFFGTLFR